MTKTKNSIFGVSFTAYDQYAVEAFRLEALDCLLKPVDKARLVETIRKHTEIPVSRVQTKRLRELLKL